MERCISEEGQNAITYYEIIGEIKNKFSIVKLKLGTGRTHQIRVHLASLGIPILGDSLYGNESALITRQALHAYKMSFMHPIIKETLTLIADIPEDIQKLIKGAF